MQYVLCSFLTSRRRGICSSFWLSQLWLGKHFVNELLIFRCRHGSLQLQRWGQLLTWDREVNGQQLELADVSSPRNCLLVRLIDTLLDEFDNFRLVYSLVSCFKIEPKFSLEELLGFKHKVLGRHARLRVNVYLEGDERCHESLSFTNHHNV